jgi:hypothetical protein
MTINDQNSRNDWGFSYNSTVDELAKKILDKIDNKYKNGGKIQRLDEDLLTEEFDTLIGNSNS